MRSLFTRGAAVTTALLPTAAAVTVAAAHADEPAGPLPAHAPGVIDLSGLQGCTAHFGLTKDNSLPIVFEETVEGPITPAPSIGDGITPVATLTFADASTYTCIVEQAWTDEASMIAFFDNGAYGESEDDVAHYPSTPVYLLPGSGVGSAHFWHRVESGLIPEIPTVTLEMVLDAEDEGTFSVTHDEEIQLGTSLDVIWPGDGGWNVDAYAAELSAALRASLPLDLQDEFDATGTSAFECTDTDNLELEAALFALQNDPPLEADSTQMCSLIWDLSMGEILDEQVADNVAHVLVQSEAVPDTTTTTMEIPDTGSGSSSSGLALAGGVLAALGAGLIRLTRRPRSA